MHNPSPVRLVERVTYLYPILQHVLSRQWTLLQPVLKRLPFQVLHNQEIHAIFTADVMQHANVRMRKGGNRPRLALETFF